MAVSIGKLHGSSSLVFRSRHSSIVPSVVDRKSSVQFSMAISTRVSHRRIKVVVCDELGVNAAPYRNSQAREDSRLIWF